MGRIVKDELKADALVRRLVAWQRATGGWDADVWREAEQYCDSYKSETHPAGKFMVILYHAGNGPAPIRVAHVDADCYADAVADVSPGNDVLKLEVLCIS